MGPEVTPVLTSPGPYLIIAWQGLLLPPGRAAKPAPQLPPQSSGTSTPRSCAAGAACSASAPPTAGGDPQALGGGSDYFAAAYIDLTGVHSLGLLLEPGRCRERERDAVVDSRRATDPHHTAVGTMVVEWVNPKTGQLMSRGPVPPPLPPGSRRRNIVVPPYKDDVAFRLSCVAALQTNASP